MTMADEPENVAKHLVTALDECYGDSSRPSSLPSDALNSSYDRRTDINSLVEWNDQIETTLLGSAKNNGHRVTNPAEVSPTIKEAADKISASLISIVESSFVQTNEPKPCDAVIPVETDEDAEEYILRLATSLSLDSSTSLEHVDLSHLAEVLRATGLFLRWHGQVLQSTFENPILETDCSSNPTLRLKCKGSLLLYCKLLEMDMPDLDCPDVPRFASICLFRATYGNDALTVKARKSFINSLDGCYYLTKVLTRGNQPISRLFSVVRNVHHLISSVPASVSAMDKAIATLSSKEEVGKKNGENDNGQNADVEKEESTKDGLLEVLVSTLAWAFRSNPHFPGDQNDRRSELVLEILRAMFAMDAGNSSKSVPSNNTMTQIGIILCELLQLPNSDMRVYQCKLAAVHLLLSAPKEYSEYLVKNGGIKPLIDIMRFQLSLVVVERTGSGADDAAAVVPILLVLGKLAQANASVLEMVRNEIFPPEAEESFANMAEAEISKKQTEGSVKAKNMAPLDAPKGTLRWKLICLMTWIESNVKRAASELLWTICDEDATQFVLRTGFGNAIHFLGIKGCVTLPPSV